MSLQQCHLQMTEVLCVQSKEKQCLETSRDFFLMMIFQVLGLGFPILPKKNSFEEWLVLGSGTPEQVSRT